VNAVEALAQRVQRAGADVAEDDAERGEQQEADASLVQNGYANNT
jgi:hypothetical protein